MLSLYNTKWAYSNCKNCANRSICYAGKRFRLTLRRVGYIIYRTNFCLLHVFFDFFNTIGNNRQEEFGCFARAKDNRHRRYEACDRRNRFGLSNHSGTILTSAGKHNSCRPQKVVSDSEAQRGRDPLQIVVEVTDRETPFRRFTLAR